MDRPGSRCAIGVYLSGYFWIFVLGDCMYLIWFSLGDTLEINGVFHLSLVSLLWLVHDLGYISGVGEE